MDYSKCVKRVNHISPWDKSTHKLDCVYEEYAHGGIALTLLETDKDGFVEPYMTASTCVDGLEDDEIAIKNWSENTGVYEMLLEQKVIHPAHRCVNSGYVVVPICHLFQEDDEEDFALECEPPYGLTEEEAMEIYFYMEHYLRMTDIDDLLVYDKEYNSLSNAEKKTALNDIANICDDLIHESKWHECAEDAITEWKNRRKKQ